MKKTLRYLLMAVTVLSVLSLSAQTHQYGVAHKASQAQTVYSVQVNPQMPTATMGYTHSDYMVSGSNLPQAAVEGTTTTYDEDNGSDIKKTGPRKGRPGDWSHPVDDPIGDAAIPLALLACAYVLARALRKHRA